MFTEKYTLEKINSWSCWHTLVNRASKSNVYIRVGLGLVPTLFTQDIRKARKSASEEVE